MDRLLAELIESGALDERSAGWACAHQTEHGVALDSALLELELVDEEGLFRALAAVSHLQVADPADLSTIDPALAARLPLRLAKAFGVCPVRLEGAELASLVASPLADDVVQELRELFGLRVRQLLVPNHHLQAAQSRLYGKALDSRAQAVEELLERRRQRTDMRGLLERIAAAPRQAAGEVLDYVASVLDFCWLLSVRADALYLVAARGSSVSPGTAIPVPQSGCALAAAVRYGGYFLGALAGTEADRLFYRCLGRPVPAWAFVTPVPVSEGVLAVIGADNGPRGIAKRWVAEITLLAARLGQQVAAQALLPTRNPGIKSLPSPAVPSTVTGPPTEAPTQARSGPPEHTIDGEPSAEQRPAASAAAPDPIHRLDLTPAEASSVQRLQATAAAEGKSLDTLVDELLEKHRAARKEATFVDEVRGLFEKLATDIPAHLGKGMEAAFRDLVPRMVGVLPASADPPRAPSPKPPAVELARSQAAPREPTDYRSLRAKAKRTRF